MANILKTNPIGQIADGVVEQLKSTGSQAAGQMVTEPAKILEQILGGDSTSGTVGESGSQVVSELGSQAGSQSGEDANRLQRKQEEAQGTATALYKLHQQRIQEEKQYYQEHKQEEAQEKQAEEKREEDKSQIVQLKKEREDEEAWKKQIAAVQGSHEGQQGKM